jgi:hypothetical protein
MTRPDHSDLEAVVREDDVALQKYTLEKTPDLISVQPHYHDDTNKIPTESILHEKAEKRSGKICGLQRRIFWIAIIIAVIIVAATVGGAVGGVLASKSTSSGKASSVPEVSNVPSASVSGSPTSSPTATTGNPSITKTEIVGPTATIQRDCPFSNNTIYSVQNGSTTQQFRKTCNNTYIAVKGSNSVFTVVDSLDACLDLCAAHNIESAAQIAAGKAQTCNAVCWRNTFDKVNDWEGGRCFGFLSQNVTSGGASAFSLKSPPESRCDSAALIDQQ